MRDMATYQSPLGPLGGMVHALAVRQQLEDIFRFRALRIEEWARGGFWKKR